MTTLPFKILGRLSLKKITGVTHYTFWSKDSWIKATEVFKNGRPSHPDHFVNYRNFRPSSLLTWNRNKCLPTILIPVNVFDVAT